MHAREEKIYMSSRKGNPLAKAAHEGCYMGGGKNHPTSKSTIEK
jgi:hypothetical protein